MDFDFDTVIDRRGTHSAKWDAMETLFGVSPDDGIAMWVADMDFRPPEAVNAALRAAVENGIHGYFSGDGPYRAATVDWMARRHGWVIEPEWIRVTHGLVSATGLCLQAFSEPGDGVILFTPVYHAFHKMIRANDRQIVESPMPIVDGQYVMDLDALEGLMTGREKIVILCSPHNPGGRVWSAEELRALGAFCERHDLILVSDEIHHDLVFAGQTHWVMAKALPEIAPRLVTLAAASKTFGLAGGMTGNVIIEDAKLRARFARVHDAAGSSPNRFGMLMTEAAYAHGEPWLEALIAYLDGNRQVFDAAVNAIPGVASMPLESTYLAWVNFSGTGMATEEFTRRVEAEAKIAANHGPAFGTGGADYLRFNLACPRSVVEEAAARLTRAFGDLQ
ncbi:MAG: MalY/PatB family protein [Pseudomonadota bacterium]